MKLHDSQVITQVADVTMLRIKVEGGFIYTTKNAGGITSCFVPDNTAELAKEYERGYEKGMQDGQALKHKVTMEHLFNGLPSYKAGEKPIIKDGSE